MNEVGVRKSAVLLFALGEASTREIMTHLNPAEAQQMSNAIDALRSVSRFEQQSVLREFEASCDELTSTESDSDPAFGSRLIAQPNDITEEHSDALVRRSGPISGLADLPAFEAARAIENEHPQVIAVIMATLDSAHANAIFEQLSPPLQKEVRARIAAIKTVQPDALDEIDAALEQMLAERDRVLRGNASNPTSRHLDINAKDISRDARLSIFEQLAELEPARLRALLETAPQEVFILAIKGVDDRLRDTIIAAMDSREAQQFRDALTCSEPISVSAIETAQQTILSLANRLVSGEARTDT